MTPGYDEDNPYYKVTESGDPAYKRNIWNAAIGLQAVDGLEVSSYLKTLAEDNISGIKTYDQVKDELHKEYGGSHIVQHEADIVAANIAEILELGGFTLSPIALLSIHERLFSDVFDKEIVGKFRKYNITKKEKILFDDSVIYGDWNDIKPSLKFYLEDESEYHYSFPMSDDDIRHLSEFTRNIWQTHPFAEGNTRTTAVFIELYMRSLGFDINNDPFAANSLYFRNALVRACYSNPGYDVHPDYKYLDRFYSNVFSGKDNVLDNSALYINIDHENAEC